MNKKKSLQALLFLFICCDSLYGQEEQPTALAPATPPVDAMWGYRAPASYQIIRRPPSPLAQLHGQEQPTNPVHAKPIQPYAYGWFGTQYSPHWYRQFGNQNAYTQWTLK